MLDARRSRTGPFSITKSPHISSAHHGQRQCRCVERLAFKRLIGRGYASRVWECVDNVNGARRAVKVYRKGNLCSLNRHQIQREALIHSSIAHPCVLPFFGSFSDVDHVYMILDYCAKGDLYNYLRAKRRSLTDSQVCSSTVSNSGCWLLLWHGSDVTVPVVRLLIMGIGLMPGWVMHDAKSGTLYFRCFEMQPL